MSELINRTVYNIVNGLSFRRVHPIISHEYITRLNIRIEQLTNPFDKIFIHTLTQIEHKSLRQYVSKLIGNIEKFKDYIKPPYSSNEPLRLTNQSIKALRHPSSDSVNYPLRDDINRYFESIGIKPYTDENGNIIRDESYIIGVTLDEIEKILSVLEETKSKIKDMNFKLETQEDKIQLVIDDIILINDLEQENDIYKMILDWLNEYNSRQTGGTKRRRKSMRKNLRKKSRKNLRKKTRRKRQ